MTAKSSTEQREQQLRAAKEVENRLNSWKSEFVQHLETFGSDLYNSLINALKQTQPLIDREMETQ